MEEQKAREERVRQEKLEEARKKQQEREAELEAKRLQEREELLNRAPVPTPAAPANAAPKKFVPRHLRESAAASAPPAVSFSNTTVIQFGFGVQTFLVWKYTRGASCSVEPSLVLRRICHGGMLSSSKEAS